MKRLLLCTALCISQILLSPPKKHQLQPKLLQSQKVFTQENDSDNQDSPLGQSRTGNDFAAATATTTTATLPMVVAGNEMDEQRIAELAAQQQSATALLLQQTALEEQRQADNAEKRRIEELAEQHTAVLASQQAALEAQRRQANEEEQQAALEQQRQADEAEQQTATSTTRRVQFNINHSSNEVDEQRVEQQAALEQQLQADQAEQQPHKISKQNAQERLRLLISQLPTTSSTAATSTTAIPATESLETSIKKLLVDTQIHQDAHDADTLISEDIAQQLHILEALMASYKLSKQPTAIIQNSNDNTTALLSCRNVFMATTLVTGTVAAYYAHTRGYLDGIYAKLNPLTQKIAHGINWLNPFASKETQK